MQIEHVVRKVPFIVHVVGKAEHGQNDGDGQPDRPDAAGQVQVVQTADAHGAERDHQQGPEHAHDHGRGEPHGQRPQHQEEQQEPDELGPAAATVAAGEFAEAGGDGRTGFHDSCFAGHGPSLMTESSGLQDASVPCLLGQAHGKKTSLSRNGIGLGRCRMQEPPYHFDIQGIVFVHQNVLIGMQDALPQIAPISLKQALRRRTCFLPVFAHAFIPGYVPHIVL